VVAWDHYAASDGRVVGDDADDGSTVLEKAEAESRTQKTRKRRTLNSAIRTTLGGLVMRVN
jgi:hypothetical protein